MNKPTVFAISGWKGSGKDTCAGRLVQNHGAKQISFAGPLKDLVSELFSVPREHLDSQLTKESPIEALPVDPKDGFSKNVTAFMQGELRTGYWTPRALAILVGSCMRAADSNIWVKRAVNKMEPGGVYVISDLRYKSEADALKATGINVLTIRVNRFNESPSADPSERDLDDYPFDIVINNKFSLETLYSQVDQLYTSYFMELE